MRETPRSQETAGDFRPEPPQPRPGRALAHTNGATGSGTPHRSDGRPPQTPRGARCTGQDDRLGANPPVPGRSAFSPVVAGTLCASVALFVLLTWQIAARGPLRTLDERFSRAVVGAGPVQVTEFLADLGNMQVALPVLVMSAAWAAYRRRRAEALAALLAMALVPALVAPLKALIDRQGPLAGETGYYPSGHAATAVVAYGAAALLVTGWLRRRALIGAAAAILGTGAGLVLRGYHWPLDVLGSWCLGAVLLIAAVVVPRTRAGTRGGGRT
ncbi:phosphatase PAP2 family protein [Streptomyces sp. NPDC019396]|uniref:phosphatase PAP2 family protein n=1 Tax=Streptomyces sp. NPDC019396 TaxID=3154687 RepID=UPI0034104452